MGHEISSWAEQVRRGSNSDLVAIPVLRGGIFVFADLVRYISSSVHISPAQSWAYRSGENNVVRDQVSVNLEAVPAQGRHVLVIDDICDSGRTLKVLTESLRGMGALEVRSAVLIRRKVEPEVFVPEYVGFNYNGPEWFVGYGMDDAERFRNLDSVYTITKQEA